MNFRDLARLLAGCLLALQGATVSASFNDSEDPFFEPLPVVLTVSRLPQAMQDTPGAVSVIDSDLIKATGYRDIARLLRGLVANRSIAAGLAIVAFVAGKRGTAGA